MNNVLFKIFCGFFVVIAASLSLSAESVFVDTTRLIANNNANDISTLSSAVPVIKAANVDYPVILENEKNGSLAFVEKFSNKQRDYLIDTYQKGKGFFAKAAAIFKQYNLPEELKFLLALESAFDPNVVSSAGAVGYWQIMAEAARDYGLKISGKKSAGGKTISQDERKNFNKSTIAVAKFFSEGCKNFNNNILLMVAAYNCGMGKIRSVIKKSGKINPDFWDVKKYLPAETRKYVMDFIALSVVYNNYEKFLNRQLIFTPQSSQFTILPGAKPDISTD